MALQAKGTIVVVTGDGVNDAPMLKRAGVGFATGKAGSEAAKDASEIVLADDDYSSIIAVIKEGQTANDNPKGKQLYLVEQYWCGPNYHPCLATRDKPGYETRVRRLIPIR